MKKIKTPFELKEISDGGIFAGYASVFDVEDYFGDTIKKGAFARSLAGKRKRQPALLWQHNHDEPIGVWDSMEEDDKGLYGEGRLALGTQRGREAYELLQMKAINGLSIGFTPIKHIIDKDTGKRTLLDIDLWETSLVTFPANEAARIEEVRAMIRNGDAPARVVEEVLRDAGFSIKQAKAIVASGLPSLRLRDVVDCDEVKNTAEIAQLLLATIHAATRKKTNGSQGDTG